MSKKVNIEDLLTAQDSSDEDDDRASTSRNYNYSDRISVVDLEMLLDEEDSDDDSDEVLCR